MKFKNKHSAIYFTAFRYYNCYPLKIDAMKTLLPVLFMLCMTPLFAQRNAIAGDSAYFQAQLPEYQRWLDHNKLGRQLKVHSLQIDTGLILLIGFGDTPTESVQPVWQQLRADFRRDKQAALEERLFDRALSIFDVDRDHLALQLFDANYKEGCFFYQIFFSVENRLQADSSNCKGPKEHTINIAPSDLRQMRSALKADIPRRVSQQRVLGQCKQFLLARYGAKVCQGRQPVIKWLEDAPNSERLEMEIVNLCDEIVKEGQPKTCTVLRFFGYPCNWKKNEKLVIRFTYTEKKTGFNLDIWLDGRYGSGFYEEVGRRGYKDMGTDFDEELTEYARLLKKDLNDYLLKNL